MSQNTRLIKGKIKSVKGIKKITKAMEMVAAGKMKKAISQSVATREYASLALELLINISEHREATHQLLKFGEGEKVLVVLVAGNKGLCGGYNHNINKALKLYLNSRQDKEINFITVGRYAEKMARKTNFNILASFVDLPEELSVDDIRVLSHAILSEFKTGNYYKVVVIYTSFISALARKPHVRRLLPISADIVKNMIEELGDYSRSEKFKKTNMSAYLFEPSIGEVLDEVLPRLSEVVIYQSIIESLASEHSSRMFAMKQASDNADELVKNFVRSYNQARQESVTKEILEIVSGAEALTG